MNQSDSLNTYDSTDIFIRKEEGDLESQPPKERWAPLGAVASPETGSYVASSMGYGCNSSTALNGNSDFNIHHHSASLPALEELKRMEMEQEQLNNSLLALTSHFAQVQFRLKQIIDNDSRDKDDLLKELEEFAFRGVPDLSQAEFMLPTSCSQKASVSYSYDHIPQPTGERIEQQRKKQLKLIEQLKVQLEVLESYAFETGELQSPPTSQQLEKQKLVIDELREKLSLDLDDYDRLSTTELKKAVDLAVGQIIDPANKKEKLVDQLKTQILDLERFIEFLQGDNTVINPEVLASIYSHGGKASSHAAGLTPRCNCLCAVHNKRNNTNDDEGTSKCSCDENTCARLKRQAPSGKPANDTKDEAARYARQRNHTIGLMRRAITLLQLFAASQLGCGVIEESGKPVISSKVENIMRPPEQRRHWGDLRARLEIAIEKVVEKVQQLDSEATVRRKRRNHRINLHEKQHSGSLSVITSASNNYETLHELKPIPDTESVFSEAVSIRDVADGYDSPDEYTIETLDEVIEEYHSDTEEYMIAESQKEITHLVRRELCPALAALMQHGLVNESSHSRSILPIGCFSGRKMSNLPVSVFHAWELFVKFYELKHGREYNESAARKLSESFDLEIIGGKAITIKQQLLSAIGSILQTHGKFKRSEDAKFKALISMALNERKLVPWLKLIVKNPIFLDFYYQSWSYTVKTGFNDALHSLNRLSQLNFCLPHDLAVRQFKNIKDAF